MIELLIALGVFALLVMLVVGYMRIHRPGAEDIPYAPPFPTTDAHAVYPTRSVEEALEVYSSPRLKALVEGEAIEDDSPTAIEATMHARNLGSILRALKGE